MRDGRDPGGRCVTDARPSDRAGPLPDRVALLSVHTSPLAQPGVGDGGGLNVFVSALAGQLSARGITVDVFTRAAGADLPPTVTLDDGVTVHHIEAGPPSLRKDDLASHLCAFYLAIVGHPAIEAAQVLHGHYWMSGWVGRKLRQRSNVPLVQRFHTLAHAKEAGRPVGEAPEPMLRFAAERRVVAAADAVLAATPHEAALLHRAYGAQRSQVHVVPPGVDTEVFRPAGDRLATRRELGGGRLLLFVGRLQPLKGPDVAVRTLAALDAHLPDDGVPTRLVVVGGASGNGHGTVDPAALRRLADQLGVSDRVAVLAPRTHAELAPIYRAADALIMPSRSESFGLVALEAQASGTPVVGADVGGVGEILRSGGGTLVASPDPDAYARALLPYLLDPQARRRASEAAARAAQRFSWHETTRRTLGIYRAVRSRRSATRRRRGA